MAGPQLQRNGSSHQRPVSAYYTGSNGENGSEVSVNGIATSMSHHTGLQALRQMTNDSELIYRGSNGANGTTATHAVDPLQCAASTSRGSAALSATEMQPQRATTARSSAIGYGGGSGQIVSIAGPGPSVTDALIGGGGSAAAPHRKSGLKSRTNSQRSVEIIVDASQCGTNGGEAANDDDDGEEDVEQGQGRKVARHRRRPLHRRFITYVRSLFQGNATQTDSELEEFETPARYRPDSLSALSRTTRFTEDEIKRIYRGFKAECPTGVVKEDTFKIIYSQFFPQGGSCANPTLYAHYVFNTLDQDHSGIVSFEDFVQGLSILSRGSVEEKLRWTFSLYDINGDGFITREEMTDIVTAIYELMGRLPDECPEDEKIKGKVEQIFQKMDINRDGVVTMEEFLEACHNDDSISRSMAVFDTAF